MRISVCTVLTAIILIAGGLQASAAGYDKEALLELDRMQKNYEGVKDYTANFIKQERVDGVLLPREYIFLKFKKPGKVYMKWLKGPNEGREALYVAGTNGNNLVGHDGGLAGLVSLNMDPNGSLAMKGNRHPITDVGIGRMIDIVMGEVQKAEKAGEGRITTSSDTVFGKPARKVLVEAPANKPKGYYARKSELFIESASGLPVQINVYGWGGELLESYGYRNLKINTGLSDGEFKSDNPDYRF